MGRREECDHFFGAGPRTLLFLSLLHQQTQRERTPVKQFWKDPGAFAKSTPQAPFLPLHPQRQGDEVREAVCHTQPVAGLQAHLCYLLEAAGLGVTGSEVLSKCQGSRGIFFSAGYIGGLGGQNEWAWLYVERKGTQATTTGGPGDPPNGPSPVHQ